MGIKDILAKLQERKVKTKELEDNIRIQKKVEDKMKSANERELEKFLQKKREERVKVELEKFRERQKEEFWRGQNILHQKNIFKGHKSILENGKKVGIKSNLKVKSLYFTK